MADEQLNYELAPTRGMPVSQRKKQLDEARFVQVRNLAYMTYKKPDGQPLMTYQETLDNRELVKNTIIQHEIGLGLLTQDGAVPASTAVPATTQQAPQGVPMTQQFAPPDAQQQLPFNPTHQAGQPLPPAAPPAGPAGYGAPPPMMMAPPAAPQYQQQAPVPPPPGMMPPGMAPPMQQAPMQVQQAPAAPAEAAAAPTGKKRRTATGSSVAPPPVPAAPPAYQQQAPIAPPGFVPPGAQAPAAAPVMSFAPPAAPQGYTMPTAPAVPAPATFGPPTAAQAPVAGAASVDLGPVLERLDSIGKGIEIAVGNSDSASKAVAELKKELDETRQIALQTLAALHHLYLVNPQTGPATQGQAGDLPAFRTFLQRYVGNPK